MWGSSSELLQYHPATSRLIEAAHALGAALEAPTLLQRPLREVADLCGVSVSPVLGVRDLLLQDGHLSQTGDGPRLVERARLLDRWLYGYRDLVRPRLRVGRYALPGSSAQLRVALDAVLPARGWAWGGALAAQQPLGAGLSEGECVIHLPILRPQDAPRVPLRADPSGTVEVLALPSRLSWAPATGTVSLLLQLAELSVRSDDRSREAAAALREALLLGWERENG